MISCSEVEEFSPFGREHCSSQVRLNKGKLSEPDLHDNSLRKELKSSQDDWWTIRKGKDGKTEEELYVTGNIVVWSHGQTGIKGSKSVLKSITCDDLVVQAFFATFYTYPDLPALIGDDVPNEPTGDELQSICIFTATHLLIYTEQGEDYSLALPFAVKKAWSMKFGILLERDIGSSESKKGESEILAPVLYSLLHPLDEINPVLFHEGKRIQQSRRTADEGLFSVVSTCVDPSICIVHMNSTIKLCLIRRAKQDENLTLLQNSVLGAGFFGTPILNSPALASDATPTTLYRNRPPLSAPFLTPKCNIQTPQAYLSHMKNASPSVMRLGRTPSPSVSFMSAKTSKSVLNQSFINETVEPLIPDICIETLWSASSIPVPSSSFLSRDYNGQQFLCLLFEKLSVLKCYELEYSDVNKRCKLGKEEVIQAKNAVHLTGLGMMVVIDCSNTLVLFTGVNYVCRLHLAGLSTLNSTLFKDFSYLNISCKMNNSLSNSMRRSTLTATNKFTSQDPKFDTGLSPVSTHESVLESSYYDDPSLPISSSIVCVRDATDYRLTLRHSSGIMYRVTLPKMWSSVIIEKSLLALKHVFSPDLYLILLTKWYVHRNTPGFGEFSPKSEWLLFFKALMDLIGYDIENLSSSSYLEMAGSSSPNVLKKFRATESGSENDWEYMLSSSYHETLGKEWSNVLNLDVLNIHNKRRNACQGTMDKSKPFFTHIPSILFALHLLYEEFKVNTIHWDLCSFMIPCLTQLAADLRALLYLDHYWKDFPNICSLQGPNAHLSLEDCQLLQVPTYFSFTPPSIYNHIYCILTSSISDPFPYIPSVCTNIKYVVLLYQIASNTELENKIFISRFLRDINSSTKSSEYDDVIDCSISVNSSPNLENEPVLTVHEKMITVINKLDINISDINILSYALSLIFANAQYKCNNYPPQNWPASAYRLTDRTDLFLQKVYAKSCANRDKNEATCDTKNLNNPFKISMDSQDHSLLDSGNRKSSDKNKEDDGMESINSGMLSFRWPEDQRVKDVRDMVCSSRPVKIRIDQKPGVSDHDFLEEQERQLYALCIRTMALSLGRGMFTLSTSNPIITEALPIPPLNLKGKAYPRGTTIEFPMNEAPADMDMWPLFHNGVASGLKIAPNTGEITSTWVVYNKPKGELSQSFSHAGFLMALGLNGHLKSFAKVSLHEYLSQSHELVCVGLLIGIAAAMRGTMDRQTTKVLSIHLECLLPPTSTELDVSHNIQVAAILGVGLVHAGTGHRHMMEVLLEEIGRPPGPEMENSNDRESYSLAAGLSLGMVMFGKGWERDMATDFNLSEELHHYIEGGPRKPLNGLRKERYKSPSYQIKEGERVNINVTSPGATMALGMIYFKTGNKSVADWMTAPDTPYLLDQVRPDFLQLRTIARGLILWDDVVPSYKWVEGHVPTTILQHVHRGGSQSTPGIDYESIHQAYYNILAGACFVLGLKFAGSANSEAFYVLWKYTRMFTNFTKRSVAELAGKSTIETCLCSILLSLSMVMAGTGDLEVLRIIRYLRSRVGINVSTVGYGSHMAIHMALGFLFLGGGRFSLSTSESSIPALIISCFPKFPTHSNDNRYHLQAFRHLYVIAAEPRLFVPVDVDTGKIRMSDILLRFSDAKSYKNQKYEAIAPHMLPELSKLHEIEVLGDSQTSKYWPVRFTKGTDSWRVLEALLSGGSGIPIKLRRMPYWGSSTEDDPRPILFCKEALCHWTLQSSNVSHMFHDFSDLIESLVCPNDAQLTHCFSESARHHSEPDHQLMNTLLPTIYEYLFKGKLDAISNWVNALQAMRRFDQLTNFSGLHLWQIKLMCAVCTFVDKQERVEGDVSMQDNSKDAVDDVTSNSSFRAQNNDQKLLFSEKLMSLSVRIKMVVDRWPQEVKNQVRRYIEGDFSQNFSAMCAFTLLIMDIPSPQKLCVERKLSPLAVLKSLTKSDVPLKSAVLMAKSLIR